MPFTQSFNNVVNVYNVDGNLILSPASTGDDLTVQLTTIQNELNRAGSLPDNIRAEISAALTEAAVAARSPAPDKKRIAEKIETAGKLIESTSGLADGIVKLAPTLFGIAKWAAACL